jgi:hypothetical protein
MGAAVSAVFSIAAVALAQATLPASAPSTAPGTPGFAPPRLDVDPLSLNATPPPIGQTNDFLPEARGIAAQDSTSNPTRSNEWLVAPIPIYNPTIGGGGVLGVGYLFHPDASDKVSPTSTVGGFGGATSNGSWIAGAMARMYFDQDRYRLTLAFVHANLNYEFFGIGNSAARGVSVPVTQTADGMLMQGLFQTVPHLYIGPRYILGSTSLDSRTQRPLPTLFPNITAPFSAQIGALGLVVQWDHTDSQFYPTRGEFFELSSDFYSDIFGGSVNFQRFTFTGEQYLSLASNQVLAFRESAETVAGDAPVYLYPTAGVHGDFRGYRAGKYRDRLLLAGQVEYRYRLTDHWGFVIFGSVGEVAPSLRLLSMDDLLPSGGAGLRFRLSKTQPINFRFDVAGGKDGAVVYFGVGEAF